MRINTLRMYDVKITFEQTLIYLHENNDIKIFSKEEFLFISGTELKTKIIDILKQDVVNVIINDNTIEISLIDYSLLGLSKKYIIELDKKKDLPVVEEKPKKCPVNHEYCNYKTPCFSCPVYNEHINDEELEDNKNDNGGYNRK